MHILYEIAAAVLFVVSTMLLFSDRVRANNFVFILVAIVAFGSSYVITKRVLDATVGERIHRFQVASHAVPVSTHSPLPAPQPAQSDPVESQTDSLLQTIYRNTEGVLDRLVRAGTGQSSASVSSDTVIGTIVGIMLAVLGAVSQIFSAVFRRVLGTA